MERASIDKSNKDVSNKDISNNRRLTIRNRKGIHVVSLQEILFMEKNLKLIIVHTKQGDISFYGKFADIIDSLDDRFLWCHRSYVINMDKIVWMEDNEIYIEGNYCVHMGNNTFRRARHIFSDYLDKKKG